jgi:hypothetical protein
MGRVLESARAEGASRLLCLSTLTAVPFYEPPQRPREVGARGQRERERAPKARVDLDQRPRPSRTRAHLVVAGPYRYVRNPMYIAAGLVVLGQAAYFGSIPLLMYAAFGALAVHAFVVAFEEPVLARRFGAEYDAYRRDVHRWLPRLPRREP